MVRYQRKGKPAGINDSISVDASKSSIGVKTARKSLAVEQSCDAPVKAANLRPHHAISLNSVTCILELQSRKLQKTNLTPSCKDETDLRGNKHIQERFPYHHETSWFEDSADNKSEMILNNLQSESGGNEREVRDSWKGPDPLCGKSFASTGSGDLNSEINLSLRSPETSDINAHSRRNSDSFRRERSTKEVSTAYCKDSSLSCQYPLVSGKPESKQFHLLKPETASNKKRKLEPTEDFSGDIEVQNANSTLKDSNILHAHEGTSISSLEDPATIHEAPRNFTRSVFKFARERVLNRISIKLTDSPTVTEIEEFFLEDEKQRQRNFMARYNYDPVNDVPLTGKFDWEQLQQ